MRSADRPGNVNAHRHRKPPSEDDIGIAAVHHLARDRRNAGEKDRHRDRTAAEKNQDHGAEKLGDEFLRIW